MQREKQTDDLVSRKATIDALNVGAELLRRVLDDADIVGAERAKYEWGFGLIESYIADVKALPSAQPDSKELSFTHKALDTISRQDAIRIVDGIDTWQAGWRGDAIESMKALPSAQPETHEERTETHTCDCISRQAAIDAVYEYCNKHPDAGFPVWSLKILEDLPSAQPDSKELSFTQKKLDTISRQAAVDAVSQALKRTFVEYEDIARTIIGKLPSTQPEIIRCKDCIFHGLCRTSPKWAVAPKDDWYCADAERRTDG